VSAGMEDVEHLHLFYDKVLIVIYLIVPNFVFISFFCFFCFFFVCFLLLFVFLLVL
jgi:hypothetical protein